MQAKYLCRHTTKHGAKPHKTIAYCCSVHIPIFLRIQGKKVLAFTPYNIKQPLILVRGGVNLVSLACWSSVFVMSSRECIELLRSSQ
jgi:hypothetical protein